MSDIRKNMALVAALSAALVLPPGGAALAQQGTQDRDRYLAMNKELVAHGCPLCHGADYSRVGPAMTDVAAVYANTGPNGAAQLKNSILNGGKGKWGPAAMPAQHQVSPKDADRIVATILALKPPA
jgi:cytochrome c551/c552